MHDATHLLIYATQPYAETTAYVVHQFTARFIAHVHWDSQASTARLRLTTVARIRV